VEPDRVRVDKKGKPTPGYQMLQCFHCGELQYLHHTNAIGDFAKCHCGMMEDEDIPGFRD
jgi:hypothetical protein